MTDYITYLDAFPKRVSRNIDTASRWVLYGGEGGTYPNGYPTYRLVQNDPANPGYVATDLDALKYKSGIGQADGGSYSGDFSHRPGDGGVQYEKDETPGDFSALPWAGMASLTLIYGSSRWVGCGFWNSDGQYVSDYRARSEVDFNDGDITTIYEVEYLVPATRRDRMRVTAYGQEFDTEWVESPSSEDDPLAAGRLLMTVANDGIYMNIGYQANYDGSVDAAADVSTETTLWKVSDTGVSGLTVLSPTRIDITESFSSGDGGRGQLYARGNVWTCARDVGTAPVVAGGIRPLRKFQTLTGSPGGGRPLRKFQNGGHSGGRPLRKFATGI